MNADLSTRATDAPGRWAPNFGHFTAAFKDWPPSRPLRIAVLGDFGASAVRASLQMGQALAQAVRPFAVEFDSIDTLLARLAPRLSLPLGPGGSTVEIGFSALEDFHPDALFDRLEIFRALADMRRRLLSPTGFAAAAAELMQGAAQAGATVPPSEADLTDFARLVGGPVIPVPDTVSPIDAWLRHVVAPHMQPATDPRRDELVASVDASLTGLMRGVLHHPQFQALESLWRGLDFLLRRIETGPNLSVHLLDLPMASFAADMVTSDDLTASGVYQLLVEQPAEQADGGYTLVLGCYEFGATPPHVELLGRVAGIAERAGAVFISSIQASAFAAAPGGPEALDPLTAHAWRALQGLSAAEHLAMAAPRFMLRFPYGPGTDPIARFEFEEFDQREGLRALLWGHPAWLLASLLAGPQARRGERDANGVVGDLPFHCAVDPHGDQVALPCTDTWVGTDAATRMAAHGLVAVIGHRGLPQVQLAPMQTLGAQPVWRWVGTPEG